MAETPPEAPTPTEGSRRTARRAVAGSLTTAGGNLVGFVLRFASNVIFARQIAPEEFGTYGFALVYASFAMIPFSLSFSQAIMQLGPGHQSLFGTVRMMVLLLSAAALGVMAVVAWALSEAFGASLAYCFIGLVVGQLISSLGSVYEMTLHRAMRYHLVAIARFATVALSLGLTIPLAFTDPGPFVLVLRDALPPALSLLFVATYLRLRRHDPELEVETGFHPATARAVWQLSKALLVNRAFEILVNRLDAFLVGLVLGERSLGFFTQAKYIAGLPNAAIAPFSQSVALRTFAALREDGPRLTRAVSLVQWALARVGIALSVACLVAPELIVRLAFGPGWEPAADMLRVLAIWVFAVPFVANQQVYFTAIQAWAPIRWAFVANAAVLPLGLLPALLTDTPALAPLGNGLAYLAMMAIMLRAMAARGLSATRPLLAPTIAGLMAASAALSLRFLILPPETSILASNLGALGVGALTYALLLLAFEGRAIGRELRYLRDLVRRRT